MTKIDVIKKFLESGDHCFLETLVGTDVQARRKFYTGVITDFDGEGISFIDKYGEVVYIQLSTILRIEKDYKYGGGGR